MANEKKNLEWTKTEHVTAVGDKTQTEYLGDFVFRTMLSHRDHLTEDRIRRELLVGPEAAAPSEETGNAATVFAALAVRVVDAPLWWKEKGNGLDLFDNNVIAEVYKLAMKAESDQIEALRKKAEDARAKLRGLPPVDGDEPAPASSSAASPQ